MKTICANNSGKPRTSISNCFLIHSVSNKSKTINFNKNRFKIAIRFGNLDGRRQILESCNENL